MSRAGGHYKLASKNDLTHRQREVMDLIVRGKTNGEIAETLGITLDGAKWHVSEILTRLGVNSREEAADWYRAQGRRFPRPSLRGLLPVSLVKAGAGVGVAAVAGVVSFAMFTGGEAPAPAEGPTDECDLSTLETIHRQYPDALGGIRLDLEVTSPRDCLLDAALVVRVRDFPASQVGSPDERALARMVTLVSDPLASDEPRHFEARWSNWCEPLPPGSRLVVDMVLLDPLNEGRTVQTAGLDLVVSSPPGCDDPGAPTTMDEVSVPVTITVGGFPCHPTQIRTTVTQSVGEDGALVFALAVSSARECELTAQMYGRMSDPMDAILWELPSDSGAPFTVHIGPTPRTLGTGTWREWCHQERDWFAMVMLSLASGGGAIQHSQPIEQQPPCPAGIPITGIFDGGPALQFERAPELLHPFDCTPSPGCPIVTDMFLAGPAYQLAELTDGPADRFRVMGDDGFRVAIDRAEFEATVRPLLASTTNAVIAIGCSDKDGPGTCIAMDLVLQQRDGSAFALAFLNSSGTPVLFGVTPEIDISTLDERREAIFGTANYITFDPPFPFFIE